MSIVATPPAIAERKKSAHRS